MAAWQKANEKLNRQQWKDLVRRLWSCNPGLDVVHRNAARIDVGNEEHYVAIAPTQDEVPVQSFNCFTAELIRMAVVLGATVQDLNAVTMQLIPGTRLKTKNRDSGIWGRPDTSYFEDKVISASTQITFGEHLVDRPFIEPS